MVEREARQLPEAVGRSTSDVFNPDQAGRLQLAQAGGTAQVIGVLAPASGEILRLPVTPGEAVLIGFDPYQAGVVIQGDDLVFLFDNGGRIVLEGFAAATAEDGATALLLPSGVTVTGEAVVAQLAEGGLAPPLETAAGDGGQGPAPSSGGGLVEVPVFDQTLGDVVELIETLVLAGALPSTTLGFVSARMLLARQMANDENILLVPGADPAPVAVALAEPLVLVAPAGVTSADRIEAPFPAGAAAGVPFGLVPLSGNAGDNLIEGTDASELLEGLAGNDTLLGNGGNDVLDGGPDADLLDGGEGSDTARYGSSGIAVSINLADGTAEGGDADGDTLANIENLIGSPFDDTLIGDAGPNTLQGGFGADLLNGGAGSDTASYDVIALEAVAVNLGAGSASGGAAEGDELIGIENLIGSTLGDSLTGDSGDNTLDGRGGDDTLDGAAGNDRLVGGDGDDLQIGGSGDDVFIGGPGDDTIQGGPGVDTLDYSVAFDTAGGALGSAAGVYVDLLFGVATGEEIGSDSLSDIEIVIGGGGDDLMLGDDGFSKTFDGGAGVDTYSVSLSQFAVSIDLEAGTAQGTNVGFDSIANFENATGGTVGDTILGTAGDNEIRGLGGADVLTGRAGADTFLYSAGDGGDSLALADIITDFEDEVDQIGLLGELDFGTGAGEAQFVAANDLGLSGDADDTALVITNGAGVVTEVLAVIDSVAVGVLDGDDIVFA